MSDTPATPTFDSAAFEKGIRDIVGTRMPNDAVKAMVTLIATAPEHADDVLKNLQGLKDDMISHWGSASEAGKDRLKNALLRTAVDGAEKAGEGNTKPIVDNLVTLTGVSGQPMTADQVTTTLDGLIKDDLATKKRKTDIAATQAQVDGADTPEAKAAAAEKLAKLKKDQEEAEKKTNVDQKEAGEDFFGSLLKMIVKAVVGWIKEVTGLDITTLFGGGDHSQRQVNAPAPPQSPAELAKAEAEGKSPIQAVDATGKKIFTTAEKVDAFLKESGVTVPEGANKTEAMWTAVDKLRKDNGLEARVGQHDLNPDDVKLLDKAHADFVAKQTAAVGTAPATSTQPAQKTSLNVGEVTQMFGDLTGEQGNLGAAIAKYRASHHIGKEDSTALDAAVLTAAITELTEKKGWKTPELAHKLDDEIKTQATPPKAEAPAVVAQR